MADFKNIPSQFDEIPEGHPVVFISYSWDSEEHKAWVKKLSLGIGGAIDALGLAPNDKPQTPRELIKTLCGITAEGGDVDY